MALKKLVKINGVEAEYFRIDMLGMQDCKVSVCIGVYMDEKSAKVHKYKPLENIELILQSGSFTKKLFVDGDPYAIIYEKIKQVSNRDKAIVGMYNLSSSTLFGKFEDV